MAEETVKQTNKNGTDSPKLNEPAEDDPCIVETKSGLDKPRFLANTENQLREKTGLSRLGLYIAIALLIVLIILVIIVLSLAIAWPNIPHSAQFPVCEDPACLRAAAQVQESWNSSLSPCEDLWGWACGRWLQNNRLPSDRSFWSEREKRQRDESVRIHNLISTLELPLHSQTVEWKMKYLYEGCLDMDNINVEKALPLKRIISELGGWYILKDWNLEDFDRNSIITNLHVKYGVSPFFRVSVQRNPRVPDAYSITISPSGLGLPDRYYYYTDQNDPIQGAYKQLIRDVVILFSQFTRTNAQKFGEDMFSYEKRIAEITPHIYESINPVNNYNPIKLSELKITVSSLPLLDILSRMYPESNVSEETEVIVTSLDYLTEVSRIASTTDKATLNSYLIWTLVREYLPYLSNEFTSTLHLFNGEVSGHQRVLPRWEKCAKLVRDVMGLAIEAAMESKHPISNASVGITSRMFQEIKKSADQRLSKLHISSPLHKYLSNKLTRLQIQVGLPTVARNASYVKDYYSKLMILKASLFDSMKNSLFFKRRVEERLLTGSRPYDNILLHTISNPNRISYIASSNTILIPRFVLTAPQFESDFPSSILYGRLGVEIAEAVTSSVLPFDSQWTADLKLLSPFHLTVNESYEAIGSTRSCILNFIESNNLASKISSELTIPTLKHLFAVNVAHQALKRTLQDSLHVHQPSLEKLEDANVFFLSYAESRCSMLTKEQDLYDNVVKYTLSEKSLLKTTWRLLPEFNDVFDCRATHGKRCGDMF